MSGICVKLIHSVNTLVNIVIPFGVKSSYIYGVRVSGRAGQIVELPGYMICAQSTAVNILGCQKG